VSAELPRVGYIGFVGPQTGEVWIDDVMVSTITP
jgi:hypothetical protein